MPRSRKAGLVAFVSAIALFGGATLARADDLVDAIALAYQTNPTLQAQRASQRALDESYVQARAELRPSVTVSASVATSDTHPSLVSQPVNSSGASISVTQPIYSGGRAASQISAAEADILAGREGLRRVEQSVLQSVIAAYVDVRRDQQRLIIAEDNVAVLRRQLQEAQARFDVGEITRTDVAQSQARLAGAQAQRSSAQAALAISRANYASVIGQNPGELSPEPPLAGLLPASVQAAFDQAARDNPQVRQADYAEQASAARVAAARALNRPTFALRGSMGVSGGAAGGSPFTDYTRNLSASAVASFPLFTGGVNESSVRAAAERNNVDRLGIESARRQATLQVAQAWNQLLGARANLLANEEQVRAATIAFEGTRQEAQVGLRTTLDVLNAEQELRVAQLALVDARHDEYVASAGVLAAIGALNVQSLAPNIPVYDPQRNLNRVRGAGALPWDEVVEGVDRGGAPAIVTRPAPTPAPPLGR